MAHSSQPHLSLHTLLAAISYWGTATRILLIGFVLLIANVLTLMDTTEAGAVTAYSLQFIYIVGSLLLLDAGYVTIARTLPIAAEQADRIIFLTLLTALGFLVVFPYFAAVPDSILVSVRWVFLVSLFVLALRLVIGLFFGRRADGR